jgi:hypothetical protein
MKTITHYLISRRLVILLTVFFFFIRLPFLDSTFLLYDERDTLLTQHALARSGHDLYGNRLPASFDGISPQAPALAMYYGVPFFAAGYPLTVAWGRFLYLLPFSIVPLLVFEILFAITKRKGLAAATAAIFSFRPWVYHISRLALEINIAFPCFWWPSSRRSKGSTLSHSFSTDYPFSLIRESGRLSLPHFSTLNCSGLPRNPVK